MLDMGPELPEPVIPDPLALDAALRTVQAGIANGFGDLTVTCRISKTLSWLLEFTGHDVAKAALNLKVDPASSTVTLSGDPRAVRDELNTLARALRRAIPDRADWGSDAIGLDAAQRRISESAPGARVSICVDLAPTAAAAATLWDPPVTESMRALGVMPKLICWNRTDGVHFALLLSGTAEQVASALTRLPTSEDASAQR